MIKYQIELTAEERTELIALTSKGKHRSQKVLNGLILLACDKGAFQSKRSKNEEIARVLNISERKIDRLKKRVIEEGLEVALNGTKGQRAYPKKTDGDFEARLIALSCGEPPPGFTNWSMRLLADKVVELEYIDKISHETIRQILKKTNSNPGRKSVGSSRQKKTPIL